MIRNGIAVWNKAQPWVQAIALLFVRITIGWQFFLAGKGKLANLERTSGFFENLGIPAPGFHAGLVGGVEMFGGILLLAGLLARVTSVPLIATMVVAYLTAHREDAFASIGDFADQAPFSFLMGSLVVLAFGPGRIAVDRVWNKLPLTQNS